MTAEATEQSASPLEALTIVSGTDIGRRREENQDSFGIIETPGYKIVIVADGMGGVRGGAIASQLALVTLKEFFQEVAELNETLIVEAIHKANAAIFQKGVDDPSLAGMGTTVVLLAYQGTSMFVAHVGDSRAYRIRNGAAEQLTEDHTLVMELVRSGAISTEQAANHPVSHMLTRSLGPTPSVDVDCRRIVDGPAQGDYYLICSDGLYNLVGAEEYVDILSLQDLSEVTQELIDVANFRGGTDNITTIVVHCTEKYPVSLADLPPPLAKTAGTSALNGDSSSTDSDGTPPAIGEVGTDPNGASQVGREVGDEADVAARDSASETNGIAGAQGGSTAGTEQKESTGSEAKVTGSLSLNELSERQRREAGLSEESHESSGSNKNSKIERLEEPSAIATALTLSFGAFVVILVVVLGIKFVRGFYGGPKYAEAPTQVETVKTIPSDDIAEKIEALRLSAQRSDTQRSDTQRSDTQRSETLAQRDAQQRADAAATANTVRKTEATPTVVAAPTPPVSVEATAEREAEVIAATSLPEEAARGRDDMNSSGDSLPGLPESDLKRVQERKNALRAQVDDLSSKVEALTKPIAGAAGQLLSGASKRNEDLKRQLGEVRQSIDVASRRLALWYSRRKNLITSNSPIEMAREVSVSSPEVKSAMEGFEGATFAYLQELEKYRLMPSDVELQKKVETQKQKRLESLTVLARAMRLAIDQEIGAADKQVTELTARKESIDLERDRLIHELEFVQIVMSGTPENKAAKKKQLVEELESLRSELKELEHLVPDSSSDTKSALPLE